MSGGLPGLVAERVRRLGPLPFDEVLELALYHPELGFYERGGTAGRGDDFLTSPALGPLFGAVLARALDGWWEELGRPDPFVVAEAGAGDGSLARAVLDARPACSPALRYVLVERSASLRARQHLPLEPASLVLGPAASAEPGETAGPVPGEGPLVASLAELPPGPFVGVVVANELLDNLPFRLLERQRSTAPGRAEGSWSEVRVAEDLTEVLVPAPPDLAADAARLAPEAPEGGRIPLQVQAADWLRDALANLERGRLAVFDYTDTTPSMARRPWLDWVRTYRGHGRGGHPLARLGEQDVTCEVAHDQLARVRRPGRNRTQAQFLEAHGLEALVGEARRAWSERAAVGDLQAVAARSRVLEAWALTDPAGLGGFRALEWEVG